MDELRAPRAGQRSRGFTLLELMVVLVLMALLTGVAIPLVASSTPGAQLKASARELLAGLRQARAQAVASRQEALMQVNLHDHEFRVTGDAQAHSLPPKVAIDLFVAGNQVDGDSGAFRFYPDGSSTGGRVTVSANGRSYRIDVDWLTGLARLQD